MEHGYVAFGSGLNWVEHFGRFDVTSGTDVIAPRPFATGHLEGFRCRSCRVVTLRYKSDESGESPLP